MIGLTACILHCFVMPEAMGSKLVYKIPYRRALGLAERAREQRYLAYKFKSRCCPMNKKFSVLAVIIFCTLYDYPHYLVLC